MGQRANYVLIDDHGWSLRYSHWSANTTDRDVFFGPDHAREFIGDQEQQSAWLDDVWCEGGALLDVARRVLLFFGGDDISYDVLRQRMHLALMERPWRGWRVRWASEGLCDFVDHLGLDRALVRSGRREAPFELTHLRRTREARSWGGPECVVSLADERGRLRLHTINFGAHDLPRFPSGVWQELAKGGGQERLRLTLRGDDSVQSGLHVDLAARRIWAWFPRCQPDFLVESAEAHPGWEVTNIGCAFERHEELTSGALRFVLPPPEVVQAEVAASLLHQSTFDPRRLLDQLNAEHAGRNVWSNPNFLVYNPVPLDDAERRRILAAALADFTPPWQETSEPGG